MMTGPEDPPVTGYQTADRPIMLSILTGSLDRGRAAWRTLAEKVGLASLLDDPTWADLGPRLIGWGKEAEWARPVLEGAFRRWPSQELLEAITDAGAVAGIVNTLDDLFAGSHPQVEALDLLRRDELGGLTAATNPPWRFDGERPGVSAKVAALGADAQAIREELTRV
jgi:crotonobetainyl-CoA:carnitine CoA-transferase CaiB-like acyl-CoA transferase